MGNDDPKSGEDGGPLGQNASDDELGDPADPLSDEPLPGLDDEEPGSGPDAPAAPDDPDGPYRTVEEALRIPEPRPAEPGPDPGSRSDPHDHSHSHSHPGSGVGGSTPGRPVQPINKRRGRPRRARRARKAVRGDSEIDDDLWTYERQLELAKDAVRSPTRESPGTDAGDEERHPPGDSTGSGSGRRLILVGGAVAFVTIIVIGAATLSGGNGDDAETTTDDTSADADAETAEPLSDEQPSADEPPDDGDGQDASSPDSPDDGGDSGPTDGQPAGDGSDDGGTAAAESQIAELQNGVWEEERVVVMTLKAPAQPDHKYVLAFGSEQDDQMIAGFRPSDEFSTSSCIGETPSCPDGFFPIVGAIGADGSTIIFSFGPDAFTNSTGVGICASVETDPEVSPFPPACEVQVELSDEELDPSA